MPDHDDRGQRDGERDDEAAHGKRPLRLATPKCHRTDSRRPCRAAPQLETPANYHLMDRSRIIWPPCSVRAVSQHHTIEHVRGQLHSPVTVLADRYTRRQMARDSGALTAAP